MSKQFTHTVYLPAPTPAGATLGRFLSIEHPDGNFQQVSLPGSVSRYHVTVAEGSVVKVKLGYPTKPDVATWDTLGWTDPLKLIGGVEITKSFNSWAKKVTVTPYSDTVSQAAGVSDWTEKPSEKECTYPVCGCDDTEKAECGVTTTVPPVVEEPTEELAEIAPEVDEFYEEVSEDEVDEVEDEVSEDEISEDEVIEDEVQEEE